MALPERQIEELLATVRRLEAKVDALSRPAAASRLLSKRQAAALLHCDRGTTLEDLIRSGGLRVVSAPSGKGIRIPSAEIDRVLRDGLLAPVRSAAPALPLPARARRGASAAEVAQAIRAIPVPRLEDD